MKFKSFLLVIGILLLALSIQLLAVNDYGAASWFLIAGFFAIWSRDNLEDV